MMSITSVEIAPLIGFAVLSTLTFTRGSIPLDFRRDEISNMLEVDDVDSSGYNHSNERVDRSADSADLKNSFLAGEDTPVWVAYYADRKNKVLLTYRKLGKGVVKQAIQHWKSSEFRGISEGKRSVDDNMKLVKGDCESFANPEDKNDVRSSVSRVVEQSKREATSTVYHPSVLAIMEYGQNWPSDKKDQQKLILEKIIYALAYWNGVDMQLRPIENPSIRLRLAGIIIARDEDDTHHMHEVDDNFNGYIHYEGTLQRMVEYWGDRMHQKVDFQRGTYNIVGLMTGEAGRGQRRTVGSLFSDRLLCDRDNLGATGVLITSDNLQFSGLQQTVKVMAGMLGHGSKDNPECTYRSEWNNRVWNQCDLDSIRESLQSNAWCMESPSEFHNPGKSVEIILPGMLTSLDRQCKVYGWSSASACTWAWTCTSLSCKDSDFDKCEEKPDPPLDGSQCEAGMMCLNGQCSSNTILTSS